MVWNPRLPAWSDLRKAQEENLSGFSPEYKRQNDGFGVFFTPQTRCTCLNTVKLGRVKAGLNPQQFTREEVMHRLAKYGDLWKPVLGDGSI